MKLKIADKWKWIAKDEDGAELWFPDKPILEGCCWIRSAGSVAYCGGIMQIPDLGHWLDSLHEILPDGTLKKHVERPELKVDDRVLVKYLNGKWIGRHFAGWLEDGDITCWFDGKTSWTTSPNSRRRWHEWKLPEDDQ